MKIKCIYENGSIREVEIGNTMSTTKVVCLRSKHTKARPFEIIADKNLDKEVHHYLALNMHPRSSKGIKYE